MTVRKPAVAGQFYSGSAAALKAEVQEYIKQATKPRKVLGVISPHAGYIYSGHVAGATLASVEIPPICIVLSPNHTGLGSAVAIMNAGEWEIPTGNIPVEETIANALIKNSPLFSVDALAHMREHSLEVQLPFLLELQKNLKIVPVTLGHLNYNTCEELGKAIAKTIKESGHEILIVASSDMTHYESDKRAREKDKLAIDRILELDPSGLVNICAERNITMCGVIPVAVMLVACKEMGAKKAELVKYATSGDVTGDKSAVVGYAGVIVY